MSEEGSEVKPQPVLVLDGGFSSQLSRHVGDRVDGDPLWTARFLKTDSQAVRKTHQDFLRAGADIILTNTYQASIGGFEQHLGTTPQEAAALIRYAIDLAYSARVGYKDECGGMLPRVSQVVGSIGPYGAHLHDGSEYNGTYADTTAADTMRAWHRPRIQIMLDYLEPIYNSHILAFETIPCQKEAEVLVELLKEFPTAKAWLSFSCRDDTSLAHGENFQEVARRCWDMNPQQLIAVGVNCCDPQWVGPLFKGINEDRKENPIPLVTYPNSGEKYNAELGWMDKERCVPLAEFVPQWLELGVMYVGGCCRTYAEDIKDIRDIVDKWNEEKVLV